jgi:hypothetical protein
MLRVLYAFAMKKSYSRTMFLTAREYTVAQALGLRRGKYERQSKKDGRQRAF